MRVNLLWSLIDRIFESGHTEESDDVYAAGICANEVESIFEEDNEQNVIDGHFNEIMETTLLQKGYTTTVCKYG